MNNFITLENPDLIYPETSVKKQNYYIVYNFETSKKTKLFYQGQEISLKDALNLIKYEGIECRLFDMNPKKKINNSFTDNSEDFFLGISILLTFVSFAYILAKK